MRKTENELTARYAEYNTTGIGAYPNERVKWMKYLTGNQIKEYTLQNVLKTTCANSAVVYTWNPIKVIDLYGQ